MFFQLLMSGMTVGSCYALVAVAFTLIFNATHIFNFAQGEWLMVGAMLYVSLMVTAELPFLVSLAACILLLTIIGFCFDRIIALARRRNADTVTLIIVTLAGGIVLKAVAQHVWGELSFFSPPIFKGEPFQLWGATLTYQHLFIMGITAVVMLTLWFFFTRSLTGKATRAAAFNQETAQLTGINVRLTIALMFGMSAALSGLAGVLISPLSSANTGMGISLAIKGFAAAILGGAGSMPGAILGGLLLGLIEAMAGRYISSGYNAAVPFVLLILILFIKPSGIMGKKEVEKV